MTPPAAPPASLDEIRRLLAELPGPDTDARAAAEARQAQLLKPPGSLGRLEELAHWLAAWQGRARPSAERPRIAVFAGNHGVAQQGVSAYPPAVTAQMVQAFVAGQAAINQLSDAAGADLRVYEMALDHPTADFTQGPAMSEQDCVRALSYGMLAVEEGFDVMALGEMGIGNTTAAAALACGLFGGHAQDWVGRGTGVDDARLAHKVAIVERAVEANRAALGYPLEVLRCLGGLEFAAIAGAVIACRLARLPVVLDGYAATASAAVLGAIEPRLLDHCVVAHRSVEPGHARLLQKLGKEPLLDFRLRLGEASGAALVLPLLRAAAACLDGMATFAEAGVSDKDGA
jgi:nicotinate-nucleotide--dimethylbenzimidazole phosphoribosyltransferase